MRLTDRDKQLFKTLRDSETGNALINYLERLIQEFGNIKNIPNKTEQGMNARIEAIVLLEDEVITKIKFPETSPAQTNQYT